MSEPCANRRLEEALNGLLEGEGPGAQPLTIRFRKPLPAHAERLLDSLGVVLEIDPDAPLLSEIKASGRSGTTRSEMSDELRARQRQAYYAREDKQHLADSDQPASPRSR